MTTIAQQQMTVADYEALIALPENADRHLELLNGELIEEMPTPQHSRILRQLVRQFERFLEQQPVAELMIEVRFGISDDALTAVIPDLAVVLQGRSFEVREIVPFMPDLAVEIQSPGQSKKTLLAKANYYLAHGARLVWLIYPDEQIIETLTAAERDLLQPGKTLTGGDVLPGFSVEVAAVFMPLA